MVSEEKHASVGNKKKENGSVKAKSGTTIGWCCYSFFFFFNREGTGGSEMSSYFTQSSDQKEN